jgi:gliding motility-associated-like protein
VQVTDSHGATTTATITISITDSNAEDTDHDGISDAIEKGPNVSAPLDSDNDGIPDFKDPDSDNDGVPDSVEGNRDSDSDGIADYRDTDSDNDGVSDNEEAGGAKPSGADDDHDGIDDAFDPDKGHNPTATPRDTDGDGRADYVDTDDDNDGVPTSAEVTHADNIKDHDSDGVNDFLDNDDDGDSILTKDEDRNGNGDFFDDDCDGDQTPDFLDADQCKVVPELGFSPNGDGNNEAWVIKNIEEYPNNSVKIFNRWGNSIYEVKSYNNTDRAWSGQSSGKWIISSDLKVPDGTYFFVIDLGDGSKSIGGYIVLKR